jgi:hypothetical protein
VRNPLRKVLLGGAAVAAFSVVAMAPASAYSEYPHPFFAQAECEYVANTIIDSQTGAECVKESDGLWHLYVYG